MCPCEGSCEPGCWCMRTSLCFVLCLFEQSSFRATSWWSRLAKRCTCVLASGTRWRPLPRPTHGLRCQILSAVVFWQQKWAREGAGMVFPSMLARSRCAPLKPMCASVVARHAPHCVRQASTSIIVCRGGCGTPGMAGEGVVKEHADVQQSAVIAYQRGCAPVPPPPSPEAHLIFFESALRRPRTRMPGLLPPPLPLPHCLSFSASPPLPFILCLSLCLPLCLLLIHLALARCRQGAPNKASASKKASVQTKGISTEHAPVWWCT